LPSKPFGDALSAAQPHCGITPEIAPFSTRHTRRNDALHSMPLAIIVLDLAAGSAIRIAVAATCATKESYQGE
jgi:hypothetical protein